MKKTRKNIINRSMAFAAASAIMTSAMYAPLTGTGLHEWISRSTAKAEGAPVSPENFSVDNELREADNTEIFTEGDFSYSINSNDEAVVQGYTGIGKDLVIPDTLGGKPVTVIGKEAFEGNTVITSVKFPDTLKTIDDYAFYEASSLASVEFNEGLEYLDEYCFGKTALTYVKLPTTLQRTSCPFGYCLSLEKAEFADGTTNVPFGNMNLNTYGDTSYGCFENCTSLKEVILPEGITNIGDFAFYKCSSLAEIKLPSTLKSIREKAFAGCSSMESIDIPDGVETLEFAVFSGTKLTSVKIPSALKKGSRPFAGCETLVKAEIAEGTTTLASGTTNLLEDIGLFEGCYELEEVTLPEGLEKISYRTFYACSSLKKINFPSTLKTLYPDVFNGCTSLTSVELNDDLKNLNARCFSNTGLTYVKIPASVTYANRPFENCQYLKKCEFAEGMVTTPSEESIEKFATVSQHGIFENCPVLEEIVFPSTLENIGHYAFCNCPSLKDVKIPDTVKRVGSYAFYHDTGITSLEIPESLTSIYIGSFGDTGLTSVKIPKTVTFAASSFRNCESLKKVEFEDGMTSVPSGTIGSNSFGIMDSCTSLEEVIIPDTVEEIELGAFEDCTSLQKITIPDSVKTIGAYAFRGCTALKSIDLPSGLENLRRESFANTGIQSVVIPASLTFARMPFAGCTNLKKAEFASGTTVIPDGTTGTSSYNRSPAGIFQDCTSLREVIIPEGVTEIGNLAFNNCSSLKNVKLPSTLKKIGEAAFYKATNLASIELPEGLEDIGAKSFSETALSSVKIPSTVTAGTRTFENCQYLTYAEIADGLKELPSTRIIEGTQTTPVGEVGIFYNCPVLSEVKIPDSLELIGTAGFKDCPELIGMTGGKNDIAFKTAAFDGCTSLQDERFLILDKANSYITANSIITSVNGTTHFTMKYKVADRFAGKIKSSYIKINLPDSMELMGNTVRCSDPDAALKESYFDNNIIIVEPEAAEMTLTFSCSVKNTKDLKLEPYIFTTLTDGEHLPSIGDFELQASAISLGGPRYVSDFSAEVYGIAEKGKEVNIYVNGNLAETVTSSDKTGKYRTTVKLPDGNIGDDYKIKAECEGNKSEEVITTYVDTMPALSEATFSDSHFRKEHYITDVFTKGACPVITTYVGSSMNFSMKLANSNKIKHLYLTSKKGDEIKFIEATYNKAEDVWTANGYFDKKNHNYIPGYLNISAVVENEYPTVDIDNGSAADTFRIGGYSDAISSNSSAQQIVAEKDRVFGQAKVSDGSNIADYGYFAADADSITLDGKKADAKTVCTSPDKYGFKKLPLNVIEEGDNCEYYYRLLGTDESKTVVDGIFDAKDISDFNEHKCIVLVKKNSKTPEFMIHGVSDLSTAEMDRIPFDMLGTIGTKLSGFGDTTDLRKEMSESGADDLLDVLTLLYGSKLMNVIATGSLSNAVETVGGITGPWSIAVDSAIILAESDQLNSYGTVMAESNKLFSNPGYIRFIIDPSGVAYEAVKSNPVEDVSVTIYYKDENGNEVKWDASEYDQENPLLTNCDGGYAWDVPEGEWKVKATKDGYQDVETTWLPVPPAWTDVDISMVSFDEPVLKSAEFVDGRLTVHFSKFMDVSTVSSDNFIVSGYSNISIEPVLPSDSNNYTDTFVIAGKINPKDIKDNTVTIRTTGKAKSYSGADMRASEVVVRMEDDTTVTTPVTTTAETTTTTTSAASTTTTAKPSTTSTTTTAKPTTTSTTTTAKPATTSTTTTAKPATTSTTTTAKPTTTSTTTTAKPTTTSTTTTAKPTTTSTTTTAKPTTTSTTTTAKPTTTSTTSTAKPTTTSTTTTAKPTTTSTTTTAKPTTTSTTTTSKPTTTSTTTTAKPTTTSTTTTTTTAATTTAPVITYSIGDPNGDGIVDGRDATIILTEYAKTSTGQKSTLSDAAMKASDFNSDGIVDGRDASAVLTFYARSSVDDSLTLEDYLKSLK